MQACFGKIAKYVLWENYQCGFLSDEEAKNVDSDLRKRLLKSPRMKAFKERWKIALHFPSEEQFENFNLLNVGFCRKFATPANQCYENSVPKDFFLVCFITHTGYNTYTATYTNYKTNTYTYIIYNTS